MSDYQPAIGDLIVPNDSGSMILVAQTLQEGWFMGADVANGITHPYKVRHHVIKPGGTFIPCSREVTEILRQGETIVGDVLLETGIPVTDVRRHRKIP